MTTPTGGATGPRPGTAPLPPKATLPPAPTPTPTPTPAGASTKVAGDNNDVKTRSGGTGALPSIDLEGITVDGAKNVATLAHKAGADVYDGRIEHNNLAAKRSATEAEGVEAEKKQAWKDSKKDVKKAKAGVKQAPVPEKGPKKVNLKNAEAVADGAHDAWRAAQKDTRAAHNKVSKLNAADELWEASAKGRAVRGTVGVSGLGVGGLTIASGINTLNREGAQTNEKVGAGLDIAGGTADVVGGGANVMRALGAGGAVAGNVAKYAGPVGMALGGGANIVTGSVKAYDNLTAENPDYEKASQGGLKAIGGTMMLAGAGASLTGVGAAAGVPLMVAGGVLTAGVAVWEWLSD